MQRYLEVASEKSLPLGESSRLVSIVSNNPIHNPCRLFGRDHGYAALTKWDNPPRSPSRMRMLKTTRMTFIIILLWWLGGLRTKPSFPDILGFKASQGIPCVKLGSTQKINFPTQILIIYFDLLIQWLEKINIFLPNGGEKLWWISW